MAGAELMPAQLDNLTLASVCAGCGIPLDGALPSWAESVNLTPDLLYVAGCDFLFGAPAVELDIAFDWCDVACFGRWLFRAVVALQAQPRPDEVVR